MLRNWFLYAALISLREWPTKDFGTLIDHFGAASYEGRMKIDSTDSSQITDFCDEFLKQIHLTKL